MTDEKYKKITYPNIIPNMYMVSETGIIINAITMKQLKTFEDKDGYFRLKLRAIDKKYRTVAVHRLVAYAFCDNPNEYPVVDHLDGNKKNNHFLNLEWVTAEENSHRARKNNLYQCGEDAYLNKYSETFIRHICKLYELGYTPHQVFKMFTPKFSKTVDYSPLYQLLRHLARKDHWKDVCIEYDYEFSNEDMMNIRNRLFEIRPLSGKSTVSEELIRFICEQLENKMTYKQIIEVLLDTGRMDDNQYEKIYKLINRLAIGECWVHISSEYKLPNAKTKRYFDARRLYKLYNECDTFIREMVDGGASIKDIYMAYGNTDDDDLDEKIKNKIDVMVHNYKELKQMNSGKIIYVNFVMGLEKSLGV